MAYQALKKYDHWQSSGRISPWEWPLPTKPLVSAHRFHTGTQVFQRLGGDVPKKTWPWLVGPMFSEVFAMVQKPEHVIPSFRCEMSSLGIIFPNWQQLKGYESRTNEIKHHYNDTMQVSWRVAWFFRWRFKWHKSSCSFHRVTGEDPSHGERIGSAGLVGAILLLDVLLVG